MIYTSSLRLDEGKQQAIAMLKKAFKDIPDNVAKVIVLNLEKYDPTSPKNKYLELFTKFYIQSFDGEYGVVLDNFYKIITAEVKEKIKDVEKRNLSINLSKIDSIRDFIETLKNITSVVTKSTQNKPIKGIKKGTDYLEIPLKDKDYKAYIPLNYKASKIIASDKTGNCRGKWCTANSDTDQHWIDYIEDGLGVLVYVLDFHVFTPDEDDTDDSMKKVAIYYYESLTTQEAFDKNDDRLNPIDVPCYYDITKYVKANEDKIKEALAKNFKQVDPNQILQDGIMGGIYTKIVNAIELGADVNKPFGEFDMLPLTLALYRYNNKFLNEYTLKKIIMDFVNNDVDWNKEWNDSTPINDFFIIFRNDIKMINFIRTLGININWDYKDKEYNRYLQETFISGGYQSMFHHILPLLISMGMDINKPLSKGESIRDFIKKYNLEDKFDLKENTMYKSQFKEKSIVELAQDVCDQFFSLINKGEQFSSAIKIISDKEEIDINVVLNVLGDAEYNFEETAQAMKTMVKRMNTAKLKSRQGKAPITVRKADDLWERAKELAKKQGQEENYAYVMTIWKNLTGYRKPRGKK